MKNKNNDNTAGKKDGKPRVIAIWDSESISIFSDECIKEVEAGHRPGTHFSKVGWENLITNFFKATGRQYDRAQLKNKWDALKCDWKLWKDLIGKETGIGWSSTKKTVDASDEWWQSKIQSYLFKMSVNPDVSKFRKKGIDPDMMEKLNRMFMTVTTAGGGAYAPQLVHLSEDIEASKNVVNQIESSDDSDDDSSQSKVAKEVEDIEGKNKKRSSDQLGTKVKKEKRAKGAGGAIKVGGATKLSQQIDHLCESVETRNSITEKWLKGSQGSSISETVELLQTLPGLDYGSGSNLWLSAIDLFKSSQADRDIFCSIQDPEKKLLWLNHELAKK